MKTKNLIVAGVVAAGLSLSVAVQANHEKEEEIDMKSLPAAVQKAMKAEAKGGKIMRVEKEGANYEAVVEKNGKQTGVEVNGDGKVVSRHDERKEHKEKGEKYEQLMAVLSAQFAPGPPCPACDSVPGSRARI